MGVSYDVFTKAFIQKVTDYGFLEMNRYEANTIIDGYMKRASARFSKVCKYDLLTRDDIVREILTDIPDEDIDEIVDIVSEGMVEQWARPYMYKVENLENILNTADFNSYSPAELLYRITEVYKTVSKSFTNMMREYSYRHGDLTDLHL